MKKWYKIKIGLTIGLLFLFINAEAQTPDSIMVYYRTFCADYHYEFMSIEKLVSSKSIHEYVVEDKMIIGKVVSRLKKLKKSEFQDESLPFYLVAYSYLNNEKQLLFTIHPFYELIRNGEKFIYNDKLLHLIFGDKKSCYY